MTVWSALIVVTLLLTGVMVATAPSTTTPLGVPGGTTLPAGGVR